MQLKLWCTVCNFLLCLEFQLLVKERIAVLDRAVCMCECPVIVLAPMWSPLVPVERKIGSRW
jgi:hypothetical protein